MKLGVQQKPPGRDAEATFSDCCRDYVEDGRRGLRYFGRRPRQSLKLVSAAMRLPTLRADLGDSPEAAMMRRRLARKAPPGGAALARATAVLVLPSLAEEYVLGHAKMTLRRRTRKALGLGVSWTSVETVDQREQLLAMACDNEQSFAREEYRHAEPDHRWLLDCDLWLAAFSREGQPILLSVTPVAGEWALLAYFRILSIGQAQSDARYLMSKVLVDHLVRRGVRYLADQGSPVGLPNGLRQFQRGLGFRSYQVRLSPHPARRRTRRRGLTAS